MIKKKYQVFVSSTYLDLKEERSSVISAILDMGCIPVAMEQFPAGPQNQWEYIKEMILESDYVVLIVAGCYGTLDKMEKISFTEKEFDFACSIKKPVLPFIISNPDNLIVSKTERTRPKKEKLETFVEKIKDSGCLVKFYDNTDDLRCKVVTSLQTCIERMPGIGWVRADQIETFANKMRSMPDKFGEINIDDMIPCYEPITEERMKMIAPKQN